jgi:hypothetical protein
MMGSAAFLMPVAGSRFIKNKNYEIKPALCFSLGGSFGVIAAYCIVFLGIQNGLGLSKEQFMEWQPFLGLFFGRHLFLVFDGS